jgi:hypothetical protein
MNIDREYLEFEKHFGNTFEKNATLTKVPDGSPPNIPRFILSSRKNRSLEVSVIAAELKCQPEDLEFDDSLKYFKEKSKLAIDYLNSRPDFEIENFSVSITTSYPSKEIDNEIHRSFFEQVSRFDAPDNLEFITFEFNRYIDDLRYLFSMKTYEHRIANFTHPHTGTIPTVIRIKKSEMAVSEIGLETKINIGRIDDFSENDNIDNRFEEIFDRISTGSDLLHNLIFG